MFGGASGNQQQLCEFHLKGNCRFGAKCWNTHSTPAGGSSSFNSSFGAPSQSTIQQHAAAPPPKGSLEEFQNQVKTEMQQWETSGMWLLSSLGPLKDHPPFPAFVDWSPEEIRLDAYDALKSNAHDVYKTKVNEKHEHNKKLRQALKLLTPEAVEVLKSVFYKTGQPTATQNSTFGAKPVSSSVFGGATNSAFLGPPAAGSQVSNVFGGAVVGQTSINSSVAAGSLFGGGQTSVFGSALGQGQSLFGGGSQTASIQTPSSGNSVFGGAAQTQNPSTGNSLFGGVPPSQNLSSGSSLFGGAAQNPSTGNNLFGGAAQPQDTSSGNSLFGGAAQSQTNTSSVFGGVSQVQGTQNALGGGSVFGGPPKIQSAFGSNPLQSQNSQDIFGNSSTQQSSGSVFGSNSGGIFGMGSANIAPNANLFQSSSNAPQQSVFGGDATTAFQPAAQLANPLFQSNNQAIGSAFQAAPQGPATNQGSLFGGNAVAPSIGGPAPVPPPPGASFPQNSLFGGSSAGGPAEVTQGASSKACTPLSQLSEEDRKEFESDAFTRIPLCPPPYELCF